MIWKMRDGKEIEIKDMTTLHIQNTIKMLERNKEVREFFYGLDSSLDVLRKLANIPNEELASSVTRQEKIKEVEAFKKLQLETFKAELFRRETN